MQLAMSQGRGVLLVTAPCCPVVPCPTRRIAVGCRAHASLTSVGRAVPVLPYGHRIGSLVCRSGKDSPASSDASKPSDEPVTSQAAAAPQPTQYSPQFIRHRLVVFVTIVLAYISTYLMRGSLTYTAPVMLQDPSLGLKLTDVGAMTSAFPMAYGMSKFFGGVLGTRFSSRNILGFGVLLAAAVNLSFPFATSVAIWTGLWFANGAIQGGGAPAMASMLTRWFATKERGTYWGLWNIGANMGGFLAPIIVGYCAKRYGWRYGMLVPGSSGLLFGLLALWLIQDSPEKAGFPPVEAAKPSKDGGAKAGLGVNEALSMVVRSKGTWLLALTYFFVYLVRQGATSWMVFYLMAAKGAKDAAEAAVMVSGLELGGLIGGTLSGFVSDWMISRAQKTGAGYVGQRVKIVMAYTALTVAVLAFLRAVPGQAKGMVWLAIAALGFCIYGPQMLIGLTGAELVDKSAVSASQGVLGLISYIGAANAGVPLAWVVARYGWDGYFVAMAAACGASLLLLAPLFNAYSYNQELTRQAQLQAKAA